MSLTDARTAGGVALRLLRITRTVADLDASIAFYRDALGFVLETSPSTSTSTSVNAHWDTQGARAYTARMRLGAQEIELVRYDPPGAPYPAGSTAADRWFQHCAIVTGDIEAAFARLTRYRFTAISEGGPQRLPAQAGGVSAYKFRDPDGHPLELLQFPVAGDASATDSPPARNPLTTGVDHSAISVGDAARSAAFYQRVLGMTRHGGQVNTGAAQVRLDALPDVAVDVVPLRPRQAGTPHVELLGYRVPRGRRAAQSSGLTDIAADRLVFEVDDIAAIVAALAPTDTQPHAQPDPETGWPCVVATATATATATAPATATAAAIATTTTTTTTTTKPTTTAPAPAPAPAAAATTTAPPDRMNTLVAALLRDPDGHLLACWQSPAP